MATVSFINGTITNSSKPQVPPKMQTARTALCFALVVLIVFALFGNILVWVAFLSVKRLQKVTNFYIVSLATADLLVATFSIPVWILITLSLVDLKSLAYRVWLVFDIACGTASILNLTFVSCDRYLAITRPFTYQALLSPPRVLATIAFSWSFAILVASLRFRFSRIEYPVIVAITSFFIPTIIMIFTYSCIFLVARRHARVINVISGNQPKNKFSYVTEMKAAKVIGVVIGGFLVCWAPVLLTNLVLVYCSSCLASFPMIAAYVMKLLQYTSSALNPYVYTCLNSEFRIAVKRLVCGRCVTPPLNRSSQSSVQMNELRSSNLKTLGIPSETQNDLGSVKI